MRIQLEDQDAALVRLDLWPYPGKTVKEVPKDQRRPIYDAREALAKMVRYVRLPGVEAKRYRTTDIDQLIEHSTAR